MAVTLFWPLLFACLQAVDAPSAPPVSNAWAQVPPVTEQPFFFSSWDRRSRAGPDTPEAWFADGDHGCFLGVARDRKRLEHVLVDAEGPGIVTWMWFGSDAGTLHFYPDGAAEPVWSGPASAWCERRPGGFVATRPLPFAQRLVVRSTFPHLAYAVAGVRRPLAGAAPDWDLGKAPGAPAPAPRGARRASEAALLPPDGTWDLARAGTGTVRELAVSCAEADVSALRLQLRADGVVLPQVDLPLADFVAATPAIPYQAGLSVRLWNESQRVVTCRVELYGTAEVGGPLRLHGCWVPLPERPGAPFDWRLPEISGPGRFAGLSQRWLEPAPESWAEGDWRLWRDGAEFPEWLGVNSASVLGASEGLRWFSADGIAFQEQLQIGWELLHVPPEVDGYVVLWWYGSAGSLGERPLLPPWVKRQPRFPPVDSSPKRRIEVETMRVVSCAQGRVQRVRRADWSGGQCLSWNDGEPSAALVLAFELPTAGEFELSFHFGSRAPGTGIALALNGEVLPLEATKKPSQFGPGGELCLGRHALVAGRHELTLTILEADSKATPRFEVLLDYLALQPSAQ